jgi:hypothetical protein
MGMSRRARKQADGPALDPRDHVTRPRGSEFARLRGTRPPAAVRMAHPLMAEANDTPSRPGRSPPAGTGVGYHGVLGPGH